MNICKIKTSGVGEVSSKYGYDRDGSQFEADVQARMEQAGALYESFVDWMKTQNVTPQKFRYLFMRYYEEFVE